MWKGGNEVRKVGLLHALMMSGVRVTVRKGGMKDNDSKETGEMGVGETERRMQDSNGREKRNEESRCQRKYEASENVGSVEVIFFLPSFFFLLDP